MEVCNAFRMEALQTESKVLKTKHFEILFKYPYGKNTEKKFDYQTEEPRQILYK